jgi:hypothetical protein
LERDFSPYYSSLIKWVDHALRLEGVGSDLSPGRWQKVVYTSKHVPQQIGDNDCGEAVMLKLK